MTTGLKFAKGLTWLVYAYFVFAVIMLTLAFFLLLFNASTDAAFTEWVYRSADRFLEPFRGIFPSSTADNGSVVDGAVMFAIIVYGIFAMLVHALVHFFERKIREEEFKAAQIATDTQAYQPNVQPQAAPQSSTAPATTPPATS